MLSPFLSGGRPLAECSNAIAAQRFKQLHSRGQIVVAQFQEFSGNQVVEGVPVCVADLPWSPCDLFKPFQDTIFRKGSKLRRTVRSPIQKYDVVNGTAESRLDLWHARSRQLDHHLVLVGR